MKYFAWGAVFSLVVTSVGMTICLLSAIMWSSRNAKHEIVFVGKLLVGMERDRLFAVSVWKVTETDPEGHIREAVIGMFP